MLWTKHVRLHHSISCQFRINDNIEASASFVTMYVHWADHTIHRLNGVMSLLVNGLLVFAVHDDRKIKTGDYRYLIITFATINIVSTVTDNLVPVVGIRISGNVLRVHFSVFTTTITRSRCSLSTDSSKKFAVASRLLLNCFQRSTLGELILSTRCSLISASYGVLHSHFVFRYMALYRFTSRIRMKNRNHSRSEILVKYFVPYGLLLTVLNCVLPMTIWITVCKGCLSVTWNCFQVCYQFLNADDERRMYMKQEIMEHYQGDVFDANILIALYKVSKTVSMKSAAFRKRVMTSWSSLGGESQ